jgi:hypothetical protein
MFATYEIISIEVIRCLRAWSIAPTTIPDSRLRIPNQPALDSQWPLLDSQLETFLLTPLTDWSIIEGR